jgi:hypothetical protein
MSERGDIIDQANDRVALDTARIVAHQRRLAQQIMPGDPGECALCGEWSGRLVNDTCAPCRDKHHLP